MRKFLLLWLVGLMLVPSVMAERKKVGLVLGGGGAKGVAHIGVLKVLEEADIAHTFQQQNRVLSYFFPKSRVKVSKQFGGFKVP